MSNFLLCCLYCPSLSFSPSLHPISFLQLSTWDEMFFPRNSPPSFLLETSLYPFLDYRPNLPLYSIWRGSGIFDDRFKCSSNARPPLLHQPLRGGDDYEQDDLNHDRKRCRLRGVISDGRDSFTQSRSRLTQSVKCRRKREGKWWPPLRTISYFFVVLLQFFLPFAKDDADGYRHHQLSSHSSSATIFVSLFYGRDDFVLLPVGHNIPIESRRREKGWKE